MSVTNLSQLVSLFERTHDELQRRVARAADSALVVRNWLFGYYLVEYEGAGAARADLYGKELMERLAASLTERGIRGMSGRSLYRFCAPYEAYQDILPEELAKSPRVLQQSVGWAKPARCARGRTATVGGRAHLPSADAGRMGMPGHRRG